MGCLFPLEEFKLDYHLLFRDALEGNPKLAKSWTQHPLNVPSSSKIPPAPQPPNISLFTYLAALGLSCSTSTQELQLWHVGFLVASCGSLVAACEL